MRTHGTITIVDCRVLPYVVHDEELRAWLHEDVPSWARRAGRLVRVVPRSPARTARRLSTGRQQSPFPAAFGPCEVHRIECDAHRE